MVCQPAAVHIGLLGPILQPVALGARVAIFKTTIVAVGFDRVFTRQAIGCMLVSSLRSLGRSMLKFLAVAIRYRDFFELARLDFL